VISFLVTYRNRKEQLESFVQSIQKLYPNSEIIISEQGNDKPFVQGQLFNLAYLYSQGSIVVLMDVDLRFTAPVNFEWHMQKINHPFMGYNKILNCDSTGKVLGERRHSSISHGGCCVFTRTQFDEANGYSNLMCGWGGEDDMLNIRVGKFKRINNTLHHIDHERTIDPKIYDQNVILYHTEKDRNNHLDGFR